MSDLIERQAAIDALNKRFDSIPMEQTAEILQLRKDLRELPSAQPEMKLIAKVTLTDEQVKEMFEKTKKSEIEILKLVNVETVEAIPVEWIEKHIKELQESFASFTGWPVIENMLMKWKEEQK